MADARVTWPNARVMADGRVRIPAAQASRTTVSGVEYVEWEPDVGWEIERIPPPEPRWEPGDSAVDFAGSVYVFTPGQRWRNALGEDKAPVRPLTRLIPEP
jgi:hypothetical protein